MRIISGLARGIRLQAPDGLGVRPTEDRVKESMFSTLGALLGKVVIDLYSGTGALGLEALSRGASAVYFFEKEKTHVDYVRQNLAAVLKSMGNHAGQARIFCSDARTAPGTLPNVKADIILADPPYAATKEQYGAAGLLLDAKMAAWAPAGCLLVLEHADDYELPWEEQQSWKFIKTKSYGIRAVSFAIKADDVC